MKRISLLLILFLSIGISAQTIDKGYLNYDFQAGEKTLFEDTFNYSANEKVATFWEFLDGGGAATIQQFEGENVLSFDAFYTRLKPKLFGNNPLPEDFSIEYDAWLSDDYDASAGITVVFYTTNEKELHIDPTRERISVFLPSNDNNNVGKDNPPPFLDGGFFNRWVHFSIAVHKRQMKIYLDQYKMLEIEDIFETPKTMALWGDRQSGKPSIKLKNFRLATGFPTAIFENGKFVTRNLKFDVNKAILKPESIVTLKQVKEYLDKNPAVKLEIGGHTDSDGSDADNLKLSQKRADSVKDQLISLGIKTERLTAKGYGESAPIDKNTTAEAKANNRRVEFTIVK